MHRFEVWAPRAQKMAVSLNGKTRPMHGPDELGWWRFDAEDAGPGTDYGYLIDEVKKPYPDPRSQWQPNGVHGLSRIYDQHAFKWTDERFQAPPLASGIVYELHIGTFTPLGTLDSAIEKLDYLADLGITHVELMPVAAYAGNHGWGYDGVALFAVHEPYGGSHDGPYDGPDALKRFVNAAHEQRAGCAARCGVQPLRPRGQLHRKIRAVHRRVAPHAMGRRGESRRRRRDEVRRFFCDNALMWLRDFHIDGLRLDAVHAFVDRSAIHFLEQLRNGSGDA